MFLVGPQEDYEYRRSLGCQSTRMAHGAAKELEGLFASEPTTLCGVSACEKDRQRSVPLCPIWTVLPESCQKMLPQAQSDEFLASSGQCGYGPQASSCALGLFLHPSVTIRRDLTGPTGRSGCQAFLAFPTNAIGDLPGVRIPLGKSSDYVQLSRHEVTDSSKRLHTMCVRRLRSPKMHCGSDLEALDDRDHAWSMLN